MFGSKTQLNSDPMQKKLRTLFVLRRLCAGAVVFGFVTSAGGNILHAVEEYAGRNWGTVAIAVVLAALIPAIFGIMFEVASRVFFRKEAVLVMKLIAFIGAAGISGITAWNSYFHQRDAFGHFGDRTQAFLLPLAIDGLMIVGSVYLIELGFQVRDLEATITGQKVRVDRVQKAPERPETKKERVAKVWANHPGLSIQAIADKAGVSYGYTNTIVNELRTPNDLSTLTA